MITAPPRVTEWKLDRTPNGGVLKEVIGDLITVKGHVYFCDRFNTYRISASSRDMECNDLELALEILWTWRSGYHHDACECWSCERKRERADMPRNDWDDDTAHRTSAGGLLMR